MMRPNQTPGNKNDMNKFDSRRRSARDATAKGAVVYLWKPYKEDCTRWERVKIEYQEKIDEWDKHAAHERVFDEYSKQWDLCKPMAEGLPPPVQKCRPLPSESEEDDEVVRIDKSKVDDVVLRPYLRNCLWLERYSPPTKVEHFERVDPRPGRGRGPPRRPGPFEPTLRRPVASSDFSERRSPYNRARPSGSSKHPAWRRSSHAISRSSQSRSPLRSSKHSECGRSAGGFPCNEPDI